MDSSRRVTPEERRRVLEQIAAEVAVCTRCPLHEQRTLAVPGEGHPDTEVVFVGEGPGYNEDQQGRPFVGAAGTLLNELLGAIGWKRQEVYITNVVKCRPPGNRDPEPAEIAACAPYLQRQLTVLDPAVVVTLGRHSLGHFHPGERISAAHGTVRPADPATGAPDAMTYAMYHPAAALRAGHLKQTMLTDMCGLPEALNESRRRRAGVSPGAAAPTPAAEAPTEPALEPVEAPIAEGPSPVPLTVEPELVAVAMAAAEAIAEPVDENQMQLF